jgi:hypothetical protein
LTFLRAKALRKDLVGSLRAVDSPPISFRILRIPEVGVLLPVKTG